MFKSELKRAIAGVSIVVVFFIIVFVALAVSLTTRHDIVTQTAYACPTQTPTPYWVSSGTPSSKFIRFNGTDITGKTLYLFFDSGKTMLSAYGSFTGEVSDTDTHYVWSNSPSPGQWNTFTGSDTSWAVSFSDVNIPSSGIYNAMENFQDDYDPNDMGNPEPPTAPQSKDGNDSKEGTVKVLAINFTTPSMVPHNAKNAPYSISMGCSITPSLSSSEVQELKLKISDPANLNNNREWTTSSLSAITVTWDGLINGNYVQASTVFVSATVTLKSSVIAPVYSQAFTCPQVAILIDNMAEGELETGGTYHFHYITQAMATPMQSQQWTIDKAFKSTSTNDVLTSSDLLDNTDKIGAAFDAKYVTGSKSSISGTDLGARSVSLSVTDNQSINKTASHNFDVFVHKNAGTRAKLTGYHAIYECQENNYGHDDDYDTTVVISGSNYFFGRSFVNAAKVEGTAKVFKLRTTKGLGYNPTGYDPDSGHQWIEFNHSVDNLSYYDFNGSCPRTNQHGARFHTSSGHRSYYNASTYNITQITDTQDLQDWVNYQIDNSTWVHDAPAQFGSDTVAIDDTGPFSGDNNVNVDEKHIDVFYDSSGDNGIDPYDINTNIGTHYGTVKK